jgi:hypothetical protein
MRAFSATGESLTRTKETKIDQCERVRVELANRCKKDNLTAPCSVLNELPVTHCGGLENGKVEENEWE